MLRRLGNRVFSDESEQRASESVSSPPDGLGGRLLEATCPSPRA
jgi:hypothetical protein